MDLLSTKRQDLSLKIKTSHDIAVVVKFGIFYATKKYDSGRCSFKTLLYNIYSSEVVNKFRFPQIKEKRFWRLFVRACYGLELSCIALRILAAYNLTLVKRAHIKNGDLSSWPELMMQ